MGNPSRSSSESPFCVVPTKSRIRDRHMNEELFPWRRAELNPILDLRVVAVIGILLYRKWIFNVCPIMSHKDVQRWQIKDRPRMLVQKDVRAGVACRPIDKSSLRPADVDMARSRVLFLGLYLPVLKMNPSPLSI